MITPSHWDTAGLRDGVLVKHRCGSRGVGANRRSHVPADCSQADDPGGRQWEDVNEDGVELDPSREPGHAGEHGERDESHDGDQGTRNRGEIARVEPTRAPLDGDSCWR